MTVGLRILGGVAIVVVFFFGTLFLLDYFDYGGDRWQKRFLNGKPVVVHIVCGTTDAFDCNDSWTVSYKGSGAGRCEHVLRNGEGPDITGWCNGRPEEHTFSIGGAVLDYNQRGEVMRAGKLIGQLSSE
jgi:hypothetical protein